MALVAKIALEAKLEVAPKIKDGDGQEVLEAILVGELHRKVYLVSVLKEFSSLPSLNEYPSRFLNTPKKKEIKVVR